MKQLLYSKLTDGQTLSGASFICDAFPIMNDYWSRSDLYSEITAINSNSILRPMNWRIEVRPVRGKGGYTD